VENGLKPTEPIPEEPKPEEPKPEEPKKEDEKPKVEETEEVVYVVTFVDGLRISNDLHYEGYPLGEFRSDKTAKANAIFAGWFTDVGFTTPFYSEDRYKS
jgi:outer membrane biosynthesis protein TonB